MMDIDINTDRLRGIASFLAGNEQFGNDWSEEIDEFDKVIECIDAKNGNYYFPPYETILKNMNKKDFYVVNLPLGYYIEFIHSVDNFSIWANFFDKDGWFLHQVVFWSSLLDADSTKESFEYYLDHFFDDVL